MPLTEVNKKKSSSTVARSLSKANAELSKVSSVRIAVNFPSRYIPLLGLFLAIATIFSSMLLNHYYGSDDSVLLWPYIRCVLLRDCSFWDVSCWNCIQTAMSLKMHLRQDYSLMEWRYCTRMPRFRGFIEFVRRNCVLIQVTSCVLIWVVVINYGKIKNDIGALSCSAEGRKRNRTALLFGLMAAPNLGLLASFDTRRSPDLHLVSIFLSTLVCM